MTEEEFEDRFETTLYQVIEEEDNYAHIMDRARWVFLRGMRARVECVTTDMLVAFYLVMKEEEKLLDEEEEE